jgi:hypothetical protein
MGPLQQPVRVDLLLGERRGGPDVSQYAAPARAEDLSLLPRTYIDTGSAEGSATTS